MDLLWYPPFAKAPGSGAVLLIFNSWPCCFRTTLSVFHGCSAQCASDIEEKSTVHGSAAPDKGFPHWEGVQASCVQVWKSPCDLIAGPLDSGPFDSWSSPLWVTKLYTLLSPFKAYFFSLGFFFFLWCLCELVEPITWWVHVYICRSTAWGSFVCIEVISSLGLGCSPSWAFGSSSWTHIRDFLFLSLPWVPGSWFQRLVLPRAGRRGTLRKEQDHLPSTPCSTQPRVFSGYDGLLSYNPTAFHGLKARLRLVE